MILTTTKFGELLLYISPGVVNGLRSYIKHSKECFIRFSNTSKLVNKAPLCVVFSAHLLVFGNRMKQPSLYLIYFTGNHSPLC